MAPVSVSVVIPRATETGIPLFRAGLSAYLQGAGISFEVIEAEGKDAGVAVRRAISDSRGDIVAIPSPRTGGLEAIGNAIAMVDGGVADAVFGVTSATHGSPLMRSLLVPALPDPQAGLMVLSSAAAKFTAGEGKLNGDGWENELAYLVNKYGFRVEMLMTAPADVSIAGLMTCVLAAIQVRLNDRKLAYRAARRCPVCFSPDVWTCGQVPGNVVRECQRCRCRYLGNLAELQDENPVHRVLEGHREPDEDVREVHSDSAREKTSSRRLSAIRRELPARARLLEIGVRDGSFGTLAARDYEYVGIDRATAATRHARGRGLEVYCASLSNFVNTGPAFDAAAIYHVLESMPDPHDAMSRVKDLLRPGGVLFLTAFDTEGLFYVMTERQRMSANFQAHLILFSRSAVIELLERSGFEIVSVGPDFVYRDQKVIRHWLAQRSRLVSFCGSLVMALAPDPVLVSSASINIVARRRSGHNLNRRVMRAAEPTHVR